MHGMSYCHSVPNLITRREKTTMTQAGTDRKIGVNCDQIRKEIRKRTRVPDVIHRNGSEAEEVKMERNLNITKDIRKKYMIIIDYEKQVSSTKRYNPKS